MIYMMYSGFVDHIYNELLSLNLLHNVLSGITVDMLNEAAGAGKLNLMLDCIDFGLPVESRDTQHMTPLMHACRGGHFKCTICLLNLGAELMSATPEGKRAVHFTCEEGHTDLLKELIKWEADVECPDK